MTMTIGFSNQPMLRLKQYTLDVQDLRGAWHVRHGIFGHVFSGIYTRIDQIFGLWGGLALLMFTSAQVLHMSWQQMAIAWSGLTVVAIVSMVAMVRFWAQVERLMWLVYSWAVLMLVGTAITNWGVFGYVGPILLNLCPLWLGLCAIGHGLTGWGIRSRTFLALTVVHAIATFTITQLGSWQYAATGLIIGGSLLLLTQLQWDMRPPIEYAVLTEQQQAFNQQQQALRAS
ncbi:hypothetical protein [Leptolyngbya sp. Heron Island J]|uniref:hypothetical protein n=1 Tax=Leptolyngbya sp. Heron Island J TaxID=1385935 RepID=UPI00190F18F3|nr:hypothetical protein [Leptolyngbya sp. Heron Island J]